MTYTTNLNYINYKKMMYTTNLNDQFDNLTIKIF